MYGYLFRRLLGTIPVMLVVAIFIFLMLRLTPSDPAAIIAGDNATTEQVAQIRSQLGLDRPMVEQFFIWSGKVLSGDFGESFFFKKTVASLIGERIEPTLSLALFTMVLAVLVAVPLGVLAAHRHGSWIDRIVMGFSVLGFSMPSFVIGYLLIYLFAVWLDWLPVQGYQRISEGLGGWVRGLVLPSLTLSIIFVALIARMTRTSMLEVLSEDYIRTARAKGQSERKVLFRHALRNAAVPIVTVIGLGRRAADWRRCRHRKRVHDSGPRPAYRRCGAGARLSDDPGRDPAVLVRLCHDQPGGRHDLHAARSKDPLLMADVILDTPIAAAPAKPAAAFRKLLHNPGVMFGGAVIVIVLLMGLLAPWLGTIDPTAINPIARNKVPGAEILAADRHRRAHQDDRPVRNGRAGARRLQPRGLWRARLAAGRRLGGADQRRLRPVHRPARRLLPHSRRHHHAHHGRVDGDPGHPACDRHGVAVPLQRAGP